MIEIIVKNALSQAINLTKELDEELQETLRYMDQQVEFSYRSTVYRIQRLNQLLGSKNLNLDKEALERELRHLLHVNRGLEQTLWRPLYDSDGFFPTGLLPKVTSILEKRNQAFKIQDTRKLPEKEFNFVLKESLPPFRYYQKDAVRSLKELHRGVVVFPTGTGKTKTACKMIAELGVRTLVITPGKSIVSMMLKELTYYFGKGKVQQLTTKSKSLKAINVVNIQALVNLPPDLFYEIQAVIIDEFHHAAADTYLTANEDHLKNCYYRIGLTATNFRNDGSGLALEAALSGVLYEYTVATAIKDGYLMQPEFHIVPIQLQPDRTFQKAYKSQIVENEERNELIREIAETHKKDHTLILIKQIPHGERLAELIPGSVFIQGDTKDHDRERILEDFRKGKINCLIGTTVIGEGIDLPVADVLIMGGGGKAKSQVMQNIGRVLRICEGKPTPLIYDFNDLDGSWLEEHSVERQEIYRLYKN